MPRMGHNGQKSLSVQATTHRFRDTRQGNCDHAHRWPAQREAFVAAEGYVVYDDFAGGMALRLVADGVRRFC